MTRAEALQEILAVVNPRTPFDESTVIADCADLDSLGLFNIVLFLNSLGLDPDIEELAQLKTVSEIIDLIPQE